MSALFALHCGLTNMRENPAPQTTHHRLHRRSCTVHAMQPRLALELLSLLSGIFSGISAVNARRTRALDAAL